MQPTARKRGALRPMGKECFLDASNVRRGGRLPRIAGRGGRMQILSVPNFEQYADVLQGVDGRYTLTGREVGGWTAGTGTAGRITIQVGDEGGPNYYEGAAQRDAVVLCLPFSDPALFHWNGHQLDQMTLGVVGVNGSGHLPGQSCKSH
jgi:hypothetical protein